MENEMEDASASRLEQLAQRLAAAIELLEQVTPRLEGAAGIGPIVATVENGREAELTERLADAEKTIASLRAAAAPHEGRKTLPVNLLAKQDGNVVDSSVLDAALVSLSLEQRIAVKAHLLRAGLI